jgi:acylphosphatase
MTGRQVYYEGRVQGVGFRYTCKNLARGYDVVGWVCNLHDGRVELQCSGAVEEVEGFLEAIAESELKSHIRSVTVTPMAPLVGVRGFEITQFA